MIIWEAYANREFAGIGQSPANSYAVFLGNQGIIRLTRFL